MVCVIDKYGYHGIITRPYISHSTRCVHVPPPNSE